MFARRQQVARTWSAPLVMGRQGKAAAARQAGSDGHRDMSDLTEIAPLLVNKGVVTATIGEVPSLLPKTAEPVRVEGGEGAAEPATSYGSMSTAGRSSEQDLEACSVEADAGDDEERWGLEEDGSRARRYWQVLQLRQSLSRTYKRHFPEQDWRQASVVDPEVGSIESASSVSAVETDEGEEGTNSHYLWRLLNAYGRLWMKIEDLYESLYSLDDALEQAPHRIWKMVKARSMKVEDALLLLAIATLTVIFLVLFGKTQYLAYRQNGCYWRCLLEAPEPTHLQRHDMALYAGQ
ncbi:hypothetical protein LTR85_008224 [Meristemomyces frigidus]|nr:hypothetical protein LTR85_008224 [Meristemomyces frigidus]